MFDYCELPSEAIYGRYLVEAFLTKDNVKIACAMIDVEFNETDKKCGEADDDE
jgi:hypothetical protein